MTRLTLFLILLLMLLPYAAHAQTDDSDARQVGAIAVGGVVGLRDLLDPAASRQLRALGTALFIHWNGWDALSAAEQRDLVAVFAGDAPIFAELPGNPPIPEGEPNAAYSPLPSLVAANALPLIAAILVNPGETAYTPSEWQTRVDEWRAFGVQHLGYVETPNDQIADETLDFYADAFDDTRRRATIGGMIVIDSPPEFYFTTQNAFYRQWIRDAVAWANSEGLISMFIISPQSDSDSDAFAQATEQLIREWNALPPEQRPQHYVIENYAVGAPVGREDEPNTVASVALWVAENALTYQPMLGE
jgi:hypothetical protein